MDAFHQCRRVERIGLAGAGATTAHIDRHHHGMVGNNQGYPGVDERVMGVANGKPGHI